DGAWDLLWSTMREDREFGSDLAMDLAHRHAGEGRSILAKVPTAQLADLFSWLEEVFPRSGDPQHNTLTAHMVSPRDSLVPWRDSILSILVERGTKEAYEALGALAA